MLRLVFLLFVTKSAFGALPSVIPRCRFDPHTIDECIAGVLATIKPNIMSGNYGEDFLVQGIDPMTIPTHEHATDHFNITLIEGVARGQRHNVNPRIKFDLNKMTFTMESVAPELKFKGIFNFQINWDPILSSGDGTVYVTFKNFRSLKKIYFKREVVGGVEYIRLRRFLQRIKVDDAHFHTEHLSGPAENLQEDADYLLNNDREFVLQHIIPQLESRSVEVYEGILKTLFKSVKKNEMFLL